MSYERKKLEELGMPSRGEVEQALLRTLLKHGGTIIEFGSGQEIVDELADEFGLTEHQRTDFLTTIYRKENRIKKALVWHRLLFRAADALAKEKLVSRPTQTFQLTKKKEWMLTEEGFDEALKLSNIPYSRKNLLRTKSYEVQKIVKKLNDSPRPDNYNPVDKEKKLSKVTRESIIRNRGFRQAVIEAYNYRCAVCGLKICSPDSLSWEIEAAHIVPHRASGRDDIWNGIGLCRFHHWTFDVGWFTLRVDFSIEVSAQIERLPSGFGRFGDFEIIRVWKDTKTKIILPDRKEIYPHQNAILWHRQNIFYTEHNMYTAGTPCRAVEIMGPF